MTEEFQAKVKKLFTARAALEKELIDNHICLKEAIDCNKRRTRVERIVESCKDVVEKLIGKNEALVKLAKTSQDPDALLAELEDYLEHITCLNDVAVKKARSYIDSLPDETDVEVKSHRSKATSRSLRAGSAKSSHFNTVRSKASALTPSEKRAELKLAKMQREEIEKQNQEALRLKEEEDRIALQKRKMEAVQQELEFELEQSQLENKKKLVREKQEMQYHIIKEQSRLETEKLAEENRKKLAEAKIVETEFEDDPTDDDEEDSDLPAVSQLSGSKSKRTADWVENATAEVTEASVAPKLTVCDPSNNAGPSSTLLTPVTTTNLFGLGNVFPYYAGNSRSFSGMPSMGFNSFVPRPINSLVTTKATAFVPSCLQTAPILANPSSCQPEVNKIFSQSTSFIRPSVNTHEAVSHAAAITGAHVSTNMCNQAFPSYPLPTSTQVPSLGQNYFPRLSNWIPACNTVTQHPGNAYGIPQNPVQTNVNAFTPVTTGGTVYYSVPQHPQPSTNLEQPMQNPPYVPAHTPAPHSAPAPSKPVTLEDLATIFSMSRQDPLPKWNLSKFSGDPLTWHEWYGQFLSVVDTANLSNDVKLKYLKTYVTEKAKTAISQFAYCGDLYPDAIKALERKFGQPHIIVSAHLEKLNTFPPLKMHNSESVINYAAAISSMVTVFQSLSYHSELESTSVLNQAIAKLPPNMKEGWALHVVRRNWTRPSLVEFNEWLQEKADAHERMRATSGKPKHEEVTKSKPVAKLFATNAAPSNANSSNFSPCIVCKGKHPLWKCSVFKEKTPTQRAKLCMESKLCFACLQGNHQFRKCPKARKCTKPNCDSTHNILLHGAERVFPPREQDNRPANASNLVANASNVDPNVNNNAATDTSNPPQAPNVSTHPASITDHKSLLPVIELKISFNGISTTALVMCDTGCSNSCMSSSLAKRLNLEGQSLKLTVNGVNSAQVINSQEAEITVSSEIVGSEISFEVLAYVRDKLNISSEVVDVASLQEKYPYLQPVKPSVIKYSDVELILGQDVYYFIRPLEYFHSRDQNSPLAVRLPVGWVLSGRLPSATGLVSTCFKCSIEDVTLVDQVKSWYEMESYGTYKSVDARSSNDKRASSILESTVQHDGVRYSVGMLWADDNVKLPNNYFSALVQLKSLEKRLSKDDSLRNRYQKTITDDLEKGYVVKVQHHDPKNRGDREWYLPHHPVINPNKPEKVRRVLNGASKFHGFSLNKSLLVGPDLLQSLLYVLLRFRQHQYAISADIEGMFLQVGVLPKDQLSLRFLWREDPSSEVMVYQYTRHIFGARDSPTCANFALQQTAKDNEAEYPEAAAAVCEKFYMDDYLDSMPNADQAVELSKDLVEMLSKGGFKLTKFISNIPEISKKLNPDNAKVENVKEILVSPDSSSHVLGLKWDHLKDTLVVSRGVSRELKKDITQRTVLSFVSSVFDPIGLVAPYTVQARLLLKEIWRLKGQQWDDPLPENIKESFLHWHSGLPVLGKMTIPRAYFSSPVDTVELHMFGDSSLEVFCAVGFLRGRLSESQDTEVSFVFGKARVAPMKAMSIPKLELQAALLATRLKEDILKALSISISKVFMWSDSTTVLQWLHTDDKKPVFVANRVGEILESTTVDEWHHVPTADNPADTGTRGIAAEALQENCWVKGPNFLKTSVWPFKPCLGVVNKIRLKGSAVDDYIGVSLLVNKPDPVLDKPVIDWTRFSSFHKLLRITAYVLRLLPKNAHFRTSDRSITDPFELELAESKLLQLSQIDSFPTDIKLLKSDKQVKKSSRIAVYSPFIGPNGLLRSTGRIRRLVETSFETKHPVILDGRHPLIKMFIRYLHLKYKHQPFDYMRSVVQSRFAVLKLRSILRDVENKCVPCRKRKAKCVSPMMSDLPLERLGYRKPAFWYCGVDYFGPFYVSVRRSSEKRWAFLFTCMTTRAVHIETVPSMDGNSCVMGIERFIARRGTPSIIWSDNGTNFVGAEKELLACIEAWNLQAPTRLVHKGIKWKYNPPGAPHHGGSWERLVRSCKRAFYAILGTRKLTPEVLDTTFCLVEQSLNARPLTPVNSDADSLEAITPNHFLLGQLSATFPSLSLDDDFNHRKRYLRAQAYANAIWSRWLGEYVPGLNKRTKWHASPDRELKTGDLVWIIESTNPRGYYPLARIVTLNFGKDGVARSAVLRTPNGELTRPAVKLAPVLGPSGAEDVRAKTMTS